MAVSASLRLRRNLAVVGATAVLTGAGLWLGNASVGEAHAVANQAPPSTAGSSGLVVPNFSAIVEQQGPAVVNVSVTGMTKTKTTGPQFDPNDPFYDFLRRFGGIPRGGQPTHAVGSGFIVDASGVILTNAHVVADASEVMVKLTDKREFKAKVIGVDRETDVAVLRIDAKNLPTVRIGNPQKLKVGEWVLAIGSPFGFENSVTSGIVSAKSRALPDEGYVPFLQTDVAINPGNSGGPLFNLNGEVVGINSQIYSRSGGYQGLSFAIPIDVAMKVSQQLVEHGKVRRGRLGIAIQELDYALAESFGLSKSEGALVNSVEEGSAAARAGLQQGDVILKFGGKPITGSSDLPLLVADVAPGSQVQLDIWRNRQHKSVTVTVGEGRAKLAQGRKELAEGGRLGLAVRPLTPQEKDQARTVGGLVVEEVGGPAARAGIRPGDVILAVNGQEVASVDQLQKLAGSAGKRLALLVQRQGGRLFIPLDLG